jgi:hypothetical protein
MSVEFYEENDDNFRSSTMRNSAARKTRGLTGLMMKVGFIKSKKGAEVVLLLSAILIFSSSVLLVYKGSNYSAKVNPEILKLQSELALEGYEGPELLIELSERLTQ